MDQPRINVTRSSMPDIEEYFDEVRDLWDSRWLSNRGSKSKEFEEALKGYLGASNVWLFANGHVALEVCLQSLNLQGEVITTPYTHCSTVHAIVRNGLTPVFCDVEDGHYTIDPTKIEGLITDRTCAIVATHVYGFLCDVEAIEAVARKHGLKVVYDAAHAFGVTLDGVSSANFGDAAMFSTHATKVFHTIEGGIVAYKDEALFHDMRYLVNFGFTSPDDIDYVGTNARMNEFEAAMGICNLRHLDGEIARRKEAGEVYYERLGGKPGIKLWEIPSNLRWNYAYFPVIFDGFKSRDQVQAELGDNSIFARKYFYPSLENIKAYEGMNFRGDVPVSDYAALHVLCLPMYADLGAEAANRICDIILAD